MLRMEQDSSQRLVLNEFTISHTALIPMDIKPTQSLNLLWGSRQKQTPSYKPAKMSQSIQDDNNIEYTPTCLSGIMEELLKT